MPSSPGADRTVPGSPSLFRGPSIGSGCLFYFLPLGVPGAPGVTGVTTRSGTTKNVGSGPFTVPELQQRCPSMVKDFDFLIGTWKVHNLYLKGRLHGSTEWIEFEGRSRVECLLDGFR